MTLSRDIPASMARALRQSYRLFPTERATVTLRRRSWLSGILISHAWATEWADAYRLQA